MAPRTLAAALTLSAIAAGGYAAHYVLVLGRWRARIPDLLDPILFGGLSLLLGLLCLSALPLARSAARPWLWRVLLATGAAAGLLASALSGTRGAWLALPVAIALLYWLQWRHEPPVWRVGLPAAVLTGVLILVFWADTRVAQRLDDASRGLWFRPTLYEMVVTDIIPQAPWAGHGWVDLRPMLQQAARDDSQARLAARKEAWQAHNDILQSMVWGGVVGLLALLIAYLAPCVWFMRRWRHPLAAAGLLVPVCYAIFGLSYSFFAFWPTAAIYFILLLLIAASIRQSP